MESASAFMFIWLTAAFLNSCSGSCKRSVSCPCGTSNKNYTFCIEGFPPDANPCERWSRCQTCHDNLDYCVTCPPNHIGPNCSEVTEEVLIRSKRAKRSCRSLKNLKYGNISCQEAGSHRSCTGRCRSGYTFENLDVVQLTIQCIDGAWKPHPSFPACISTSVVGERTSCRCQYKGTCAEDGSCICTRGRTGRYCERLERMRATCPDPGIPSGSSRWNDDGTAASLPLDFREGESVVYSCSSSEAVQRGSRITCMSDGTWSAKPPQCIEPGGRGANSVRCKNPGPISNGRLVDLSRRPVRNANSREYDAGTRLQYSCVNGYIIRGASILVCKSDGTWNVRSPICVEDCGHSQIEGEGKISHGDRAVPGEWPWVVSISETIGNYTNMICGGALLDRNTVITAAHCLEDAPELTLRFGKIHLSDRRDDNKVQVRQSNNFIYHVDYDNENFDNDIGLIYFSPSIRYSDRIQPVCLPTRDTTAFNIAPKNTGYVAGWGKTETDLPSEIMMLANLPIQPDDRCVEVFDNHDVEIELKGDNFCAGFEESDISACRGDSGSPMVFYNRISARYTIEGIVSYGISDECGEPGRFTVFTKVARYMPWILRNWRT